MSPDLYDRQRIEHIRDMMPKVMDLALPNDRIVMGLSGDPMLSKSARRQEGTVLSVDKRTMRVRMDDGATRTLDSTSLNPDSLFEFSEDSFKDVIRRSVDPTVADHNNKYRGSNVSDVANLQKELREFQESVVNTMGEMAKDISKMSNENDSFSSIFAKEYRGMKY